MTDRIVFLAHASAPAGAPVLFTLAGLSKTATTVSGAGAWMARSAGLSTDNRGQGRFLYAARVATAGSTKLPGVGHEAFVSDSSAPRFVLTGLDRSAAGYSSGRWLSRPVATATAPDSWLDRTVVFPVAVPTEEPCLARLTQLGAEIALAPSPGARLTLVGAEVAAQYVGQNARVTQVGMEAAICPSTVNLRLTELGREVMMRPMPVAGRPALLVRPLFDASRIINRKGL